MANKRTLLADFYCFEDNGSRKSKYLRNLLDRHVGSYAPAHSIGGDPNTKHQIRSISKSKKGEVYMAIFGKLRHGEQPEQASETDSDKDVELLPGHGLVEKSHFLFYPDINLIVYQRNRNVGRNTQFQNYLNTPDFASRALVPILMRDSYKRLMLGGELKKIEVSIRAPILLEKQDDPFVGDYIKLFSDSGAGNVKLIISGRSDKPLKKGVKEALVKLSKFGKTRVARATTIEENADDDVIDLLVDRVFQSFEVDVESNGRPSSSSIFAGLADAKLRRAADLKSFYSAA